jgi:hypothetical protein
VSEQATGNPAGSPRLTDVKVNGVPASESEFDRFKDLAQKLVKVSKAEVDDQRTKS